jgi:broad specificity phosphatase PhoE
MPNDLVLVRHGESEGNVAMEAGKAGDRRHFTDEFMTTPGHQWRLTPTGCAQAQAIGDWIASEVGDFDRHYVSPYVRTKETAGHLGLAGAQWRLNRALRERDWGDIGARPIEEFKSRPEFKWNAEMKRSDPLYWVAPGGESIAHVAEDRVRNVLDTLHRESAEQRVICVCHGEVMWAFRLVLERIDDSEFVTLDKDPAEKIHNCTALHYTRLDPATGEQARRPMWKRRAHPELRDGRWQVTVGPWQRIEFRLPTNAELLAEVAAVPSLVDVASIAEPAAES